MTRATLVLAAHSLKRIRGMLIAMAVVLSAFQFVLTRVALVLHRTGAFNALSSFVPDFIRAVAGPQMLVFMSFTGIVSLGYFHPIVLSALLGLAIAIATEPAAEVESRFVDLALTRPLARREVISRTLIVLVASEVLLLALMTAASWTGLVCCTPVSVPRPPFSLLRGLAVALGAIVLCCGGLAVAVAAAVRRRAVASAIAGISVLVMYLLDYLGRVWEPAREPSRFSPFHYFEPLTLVSGAPLNGPHIAALLAIGAAGAAVGYIVFERRDL